MKTCHLVFQTHWDREWYFPFETYRYRLIHVIKRVLFALDHHEIEQFVLDGQTLPLVDFLEVCEEEDRNKILSYIKENKIIIGPWYIAMDEFLVHGESIIRNLEIGEKTAGQYGKNQRLGYLPDTFGHIGQMPQILKQFDIEDAMMWRGINLEHSEFIWEGKDGSKLFTIFLSEGYYQDGFNSNQYQELLSTYTEKISKKATTQHLLYTAGGDHLMPVNDSIKERIDQLNQSQKDIKFMDNSYENYIAKVKKDVDLSQLQTLKGELRDNTNSYILPNVLSTRSYLKVLNQKLEDQMLFSIEPLMMLSFMHKKAPFSYVEHLWKMILQNQPHDSICGCSVDAVHKENEMRALKASQMIDMLKQDIQSNLGLKPLTFYTQDENHILHDDEYVSIFNPYPYRYSGTIPFKIYLHEAHATDTGLTFQSKNQKEFVAVVEKISKDRLFESPLDYPPAFRQGKVYEGVVHLSDLTPMGISTFKITASKQQELSKETNNHISNHFIEVKLNNDGTLEVTDKKTKKIYHQWHQFYASLDQGDSYNYSKPTFDELTIATLDGKPSVFKSDVYEKMQYDLILETPKGLASDRNHGLLDKVKTKIHVELTIYHDKTQVYAKTTIDQKAMDQRLRVSFDLEQLIKSSYSDQPFEIVERQANRKEVFETTRLKEVDVVVDPSLSMIALEDKDYGIEFFHRGLHEYQTYEENQHTHLALTLIRSVSHLSRDDFRSRGGAAGPNLETPDAQMIGTYDFEYAFGPKTSEKKVFESYKDAQAFRRSFVWFSGKNSNVDSSLLSYSQAFIDHTSVRMIDEHTYEFRFFNLSDQEQILKFSTDLSYQQIYEVQMNKQVIKPLENLVCTFKPYEIKTIHLKR